MLRAMAMNMSMLAPYDEAKERLNKYYGATQDSKKTRIIASFIAGALCSCASLPFDNIKTKVQKMKPGADGKVPYTGFFDCALKVNQSSLSYVIVSDKRRSSWSLDWASSILRKSRKSCNDCKLRLVI